MAGHLPTCGTRGGGIRKGRASVTWTGRVSVYPECFPSRLRDWRRCPNSRIEELESLAIAEKRREADPSVRSRACDCLLCQRLLIPSPLWGAGWNAGRVEAAIAKELFAHCRALPPPRRFAPTLPQGGGIRTRDRLTQTARTQTPCRHTLAAPALQNPRAPRTARPLLPPPPAAPPASASHRRAMTPVPFRRASCDRADRGTPARTARPDAPGRDWWRRGEILSSPRPSRALRHCCASARAPRRRYRRAAQMPRRAKLPRCRARRCWRTGRARAPLESDRHRHGSEY